MVRTAGSVVISLLLVTAGVYLARKAGGVFAHPIVAARLLAADEPARLPVPVQGVRPAQLIDSWGSPRPGGRSHRGIDIFAPRGRPIVSTTRGIVVTVGHNLLGGRIVRVFGPGGQWHYYAHLDRFGDIRTGDLVGAGTVLGYVGDSGNARGTPPHLHYGIYRFRGGAINPYPLLKNF
jgi:murein DD-endopeptidase MepM/ murein hydrolase activator NlpD